MNYKILGVWLCISLYSSVLAQSTEHIKGIVLDAVTQAPVEGAQVVGKTVSTRSSSDGKFALKRLSQKSYTLVITHPDYFSKTITIVVKTGMKPVRIMMTRANVTLDEVTVMGASKQQKNKANPLVSEWVSKDFLVKNRDQSLMQSLTKIPGISTINIGSGQSKPLIRGLGFNRVVVVQNGIKHQAQQWGHDHGLEIDQYDIETIRLIKGPASLLYGSDAIGGVVDIQPKVPPKKHSMSGAINLLAQSNNELWGVSAGFEKRNEQWFYRGRITYKDYGDYKVPTDQIHYDNYIFKLHKRQLRNTAGREANASFSAGIVAANFRSETTVSNVYAKNGFFANAHGLEVRSSQIDFDRYSRDIDLPFHQVNHLKITNNTTIFSGHHKLDIDLGFQQNNRHENSEPAPHGYMPKPPNSRERSFKKNTYSLNLMDAFRASDRHKISLGINTEWQQNEIGGWGFLIPEYRQFSIGIFAHDYFKITDKLSFQVGLRYDFGQLNTDAYRDWFLSPVKQKDATVVSENIQRAEDARLSFGNLSASLGLSYVGKKTTYKINFGKSFRMPLANELTSNGVNYHMYRYEKGHPNLDPEVAYQLDFEMTHHVGNFNIKASPFVSFFENFIYLNPTPNYYETIQIYDYTQSEVFRFGGEISVGITMRKLALEASGEYVYSEQKSGPKKGFTLPFSPPLSFLISGDYQLGQLGFLKKSRLAANFRLSAAQENIVPPEERTKGYQTLNLSVGAQWSIFKKMKPFELQLKINNVLNTKYFNHTSFYRLIDVPEAGRNVALSITIPFQKNKQNNLNKQNL